MTVGEKIKKLRLEKGLKESQLAKMVGVSRQAVNNWENGKRQPPLKSTKKLLDALGVSSDTFLNVEVTGPHWVSVKKRPPDKSGKYVCAALLPDERGGVRELISVYTFERTSDADKSGRWEAPRAIIACWLEGLEMPDMEGVL